MAKRILYIIALIAMMSFSPALQQEASARIELNDMEVLSVKIEQSGKAITVSNAAGKTLRIYNLIGSLVTTVHIDSNEKRTDLTQLPKGIYLVKVANVSKKIQISDR